MGDYTFNNEEMFRQAIFYAAEKIGKQALADKFKVSPETIQRWIDGKSVPPKSSRDNLQAKAIALLRKTNEEINKKEFSSFISEALKKVSARDIAGLCETCIGTVSRWANGYSSPHPRIRKFLMQLIQEKLLQNKKAD